MRAFPLWVYDLYELYKIIYRFIILRIPPEFRPRPLPGENLETRGPPPREQKKPGLSTGPRLPALSARIRNKSHLTALSAAFAALSASLARCAAALASAALTMALS